MSGVMEVLVKDLEGIALLLEPLDATWQYLLEFVDATEGIMEGDDGTVAGVAFHVLKDLLCSQTFGVVASDHVPHDNGVVATQANVLGVLHPSTWRTEKIGVDELVRFVGIAQIAAAGHGETSDVVEGVVAQAMTMRADEFEEFRVLANIVTHHEERGFDPIAVECVDEPRGRFRDGSIVEGQIDCLLRWIHSPDGTGIEPS